MDRKDCIFCRIADRDVPSPLLYEDEYVCAFRDLHPKAPTHILIVPKKHVASLAELAGEEDFALVARIARVAQKLAEEEGIADSGYRLLTNCRADAGQEVPHLHFHLLGGRRLSDIC
ncbi:MAG: histidine triad nucleotide-binding protein [Firmicutes bacterium]|nr:histidine triad nucleotide-binding protein [Bacillota bacterium]